MIYKGYKTEIYLNNKQKTLCIKNANAARFAYNWGLNKKKIAIESKSKIPSSITLHKELIQLKKTEFTWLYETSKCSPQEALDDLDNAFKNFFRKRKLRKHGLYSGELGFPKFKNKKHVIKSFRLRDKIKITSNYIRLPRIGWVKLKEHSYLPNNVKILSVTVSERANRWFISVKTQQNLLEYTQHKDTQSVIGVDLGILKLVTCSDGKTYDNPRPLKKNLRKLARLQRSISRKQKGSKNRQKAHKKVNKLYYKISNIRKDTLHKITTTLAKTKRVIGIEDLNVIRMFKNSKLSLAISDVGFGEFIRQLTYKGQWYNCEIVKVDRFFPSSKTCHICGLIDDDLKLSDRSWTCDGCDTTHDRDLNASINLEYVADSSSETLNAYRKASFSSKNYVGNKTFFNEVGMKHEISNFDQFSRTAT